MPKSSLRNPISILQPVVILSHLAHSVNPAVILIHPQSNWNFATSSSHSIWTSPLRHESLTMSVLLRRSTPARFLSGNIRQLSSSTVRFNTATAATPTPKPRRPVGGVRGALFGFFLGTTLTGLFGYYYVIDIYRDSNSLLLEDLLHLQRHVSKVEDRIKELEGSKK
ncbi:hypothetical protein V1509DRAFT_345926 [Lipomyces kononenkoae]